MSCESKGCPNKEEMSLLVENFLRLQRLNDGSQGLCSSADMLKEYLKLMGEIKSMPGKCKRCFSYLLDDENE